MGYWLYYIMAEERFLRENIKEFLLKAKESKSDRAYNSAVTLFFKAIAVAIDLFLLKKEGFIPSNHAKRFRILEEKYDLLYKILDKDFSIYQRSYKLRLTKEYAEVLENDLREVIRFTKININY